MAAIDDLIAQVEDRALRERLRVEMDRITRGKKFGLVFEEHLPEVTPVHGAHPRKGNKVALRDGPLTDLWRVLAVQGGDARCRNAASGETHWMPVDGLVVVRAFGDPIFPALTPVARVQNGPDGHHGAGAPWHTLIEAENYHALQLLEYLYAGQVDCIYIDPPYNTGAKDWKYNNDYVDGNDRWRHSKWLAMMQRRLGLAKRLLNPKTGVLIVTIDEKEVHRLGLLLEQIFSETDIQMCTIVINPSGTSRGLLSRVEEHAFFVFFGSALPCRVTDNLLTETAAKNVERLTWESLLRRGNTWYRHLRPNLCYPILIDPESGEIKGIERPFDGTDETSRSRKIAGLDAAWPVRTDGRLGIWRKDGPGLMKLVEKGFAYASAPDKKRGTWSIKYLMSGTTESIASGKLKVERTGNRGQVVAIGGSAGGAIIKTVWNRAAHNAGMHGSALLRTLLPGRSFPFPKALYAVEDALRVVIGSRKDALILDFFAGSGTTAHAVMRLNRQDGGRRQCISVTNNEVAADEQKALREQGLCSGDPDWEKWGVCKYITMPRLAAAITGKTPEGEPLKGDYKFTDEFPMAGGFPANLEYFRLAFLDKDQVELGRAFRAILPLLWLRAGAIGPRPALPEEGPVPAMLIPAENPFAVLVEESRFAQFAARLREREDLTHVFLVTDSEEAFREMARELLCPNVIQLYRDYLENFVLNRDDAGK